MKSVLSIAGAALAMSGSVAAVGKAIINNKCDFDVYMWHVDSDHSDSSPTVISAGSGTYSETYKTCSSGGVSLKLSNSSTITGSTITQYEYTLGPEMLWYDLSNVNCAGTACPFQPYGMTLTPSSDCAVVTCPGGPLSCKAAYTLFDDDWASHGCATSVDLTLELCTTSTGSSSSDDSDSSDSAGYIGAGSSSSKAAATTEAKVAAAAAEPTTSSTPSPTPSTPSSTTLATSTKPASKAKPASSVTTPPAQFNEAIPTQWVTEMVYETVQSTVVVTVPGDSSHEKYHKNKGRQAPHPHARRHHHE